MAIDLKGQIKVYGAQLVSEQAPITSDEVRTTAATLPDVAVGPTDRDGNNLRRRAWVAAVAVALVILVFAPLLFLNGGSEPDVGSTIATTAPVSTEPPPSTVPESASTTIPLPGATTGLSIVSEVVTTSSIGDLSWTVYEGEPSNGAFSEEFQALVSQFHQMVAPDADLVARVFSIDGVVAHVDEHRIGSAGDVLLSEWNVRFDWVATALLTAEAELVDRSDNGKLLGPVYRENGTVEVTLFESEDDRGEYVNRLDRRDGIDPIGVVATYELILPGTGAEGSLRVVDADSGELVGTVAVALPITDVPAGPFGWGPFMTAQSGDAIERVNPPWAEKDANWLVLDVERGILVYVEEGPSHEGEGFEVWETQDGSAWTNVGPPTGLPVGYYPMNLVTSNGVFLTVLDHVSGPNLASFYLASSSNGLDWDVVDELPEDHGTLYELGGGFAWVVMHESFSVRTSVDGQSWDAIDTSGIPRPVPGVSGSFWSGSIGDLVWFAHAPEGRPEQLWVLEMTGD